MSRKSPPSGITFPASCPSYKSATTNTNEGLDDCPENSRVVVYFQSKEQQELAKLELEPLMQELQRDHALDPIRLRVDGVTYLLPDMHCLSMQ